MSSIGFALSRSRDLLRRLLPEHAPDDARRELAERVVKQLEGSGFEVDEQARALRQRPPTATILHQIIRIVATQIGAPEVSSKTPALQSIALGGVVADMLVERPSL
jgi:hypothetical protein